jgi:hypothetical protein
MTIPATHKDAVVAYLTEHGEQRGIDIYKGMSLHSPFVHIGPYLLKLLCKEGRLERVGLDNYRVAHPKVEDAE